MPKGIRQESRVLGWLATLIVALALAGAPCIAGVQTILTPGADGLMRVQEVGANAQRAGSSLRWTLQARGGRSLTGLIPGTEGPEFDAYPWLFHDPQTGLPALVWSLHNGVDYDLALSRFDGESWSAPVLLVSTARDEIEPRAYPAADGSLHLIWNLPGDRDEFYYAIFRSDTGVAVTDTQRIVAIEGPRADSQWVPEGGTDEPGTSYNDCDKNPQTCHCYRNTGFCISNGGVEEGVAVCDTFSVVVRKGREFCIVTRTSDGWETGACVTASGPGGPQDLLRSLSMLSSLDCH